MKIICKNLRQKNGVSVIEILIVVFIIVVALVGLVKLADLSLLSSFLAQSTVQANDFAVASLEAVRNFRDGTVWDTDGLGILTPGISYSLQKTGDNPPKWALVPGQTTDLGFTRQILFSQVYRDGNDNIVTAGGVLDPDTKKVTVIVSWRERGRNHQISLDAYLTNWQ